MNNKKCLFLDDNKERTKTFLRSVPSSDTALTAKECIEKLKEEEYDCVFLDHDLGGEIYVESEREDCGMEVVRWIVENSPKIKKIVIHTCNTPAATEMYNKLINNYDCQICSFIDLNPIMIGRFLSSIK